MIIKRGRLMVAIVCALAFLATGMLVVSESSDADESFCAKIGDTPYASFDQAIVAANGMTGEVTIQIYGPVNYTNSTPNLNGDYDKINFVGMTDDAEIYIERQGSNGYISGPAGSGGADVSFRDLILSKNVGSGGVYDAGHMNTFFTVYRVGDVSYTNCTFPNGACTQGTVTTYTRCTFNNMSGYGLWVYANTTCTVIDCDFTGVRGVKMYSENVIHPEVERDNHLILMDTRFHDSVTEKSAIVLTYGHSIVLENNVYPSTGMIEIDNGTYHTYNGTQIQSDVRDLVCTDHSGNVSGVLVTDSNGMTRLYNRTSDVVEVAQSGDVVTLLYDTSREGPVSLGSGVILDLNGHDAQNVVADVIIDSTIVPEEPEIPSTPSEDEGDYPFFPWNSNNQGTVTTPTDDTSDDKTTIIAAAAAIVVIMLAAVALMVNRNN